MPQESVRTAVDACLAQIDRHDRALQAWVVVDREGAQRRAEALDAHAGPGARDVVFGMPVAVKDIFDAAGLVTTSGAGPFAHRRPTRDAFAVAALRAAGAVILGKTVTTEFAFTDPSITRNPWNLEHTPGGSSSGSAAAVAAGMAQVGLGSQTIGSTIRPAAYCGIVGFKGTYGRVSTEGATPLAWSLDHVGIFARGVDDAARVFSVLAGDPAAAASGPLPLPDHPPRLAVPTAWIEAVATPVVGAHLSEIAARLGRAGATITDVALPASASRIEIDGRLVLRAEAAAYHAQWFSDHAEEYAPRIRELVASGLQVAAADYIRAHDARYGFRRDLSTIFGVCDAVLVPPVPSPAPPLTDDTTGDPVFCVPWTFAGLPTIALPSGLTPDDLPLAIQLVGPIAADVRLLEIARWCETQLAFTAAPPLRRSWPAI